MYQWGDRLGFGAWSVRRRVSFVHDTLSPCAHEPFRAAPTARRAQASQNAIVYPDIDEARALQALLRQIIERHVGAARDWRALKRVLELCRRAAAAVDDRYCRDKLRLVEDFAAEMFSQGESRSEFLKREILNALELFHSRLYSLEMLRRAAARSAKRVALART